MVKYTKGESESKGEDTVRHKEKGSLWIGVAVKKKTGKVRKRKCGRCKVREML